jgi:hypothetical protein
VIRAFVRRVLGLDLVEACRRCGRDEAAHRADDAEWIANGCPEDQEEICNMYLPGWKRRASR